VAGPGGTGGDKCVLYARSSSPHGFLRHQARGGGHALSQVLASPVNHTHTGSNLKRPLEHLVEPLVDPLVDPLAHLANRKKGLLTTGNNNKSVINNQQTNNKNRLSSPRMLKEQTFKFTNKTAHHVAGRAKAENVAAK